MTVDRSNPEHPLTPRERAEHSAHILIASEKTPNARVPVRERLRRKAGEKQREAYYKVYAPSDFDIVAINEALTSPMQTYADLEPLFQELDQDGTAQGVSDHNGILKQWHNAYQQSGLTSEDLRAHREKTDALLAKTPGLKPNMDRATKVTGSVAAQASHKGLTSKRYLRTQDAQDYLDEVANDPELSISKNAVLFSEMEVQLYEATYDRVTAENAWGKEQVSYYNRALDTRVVVDRQAYREFMDTIPFDNLLMRTRDWDKREAEAQRVLAQVEQVEQPVIEEVPIAEPAVPLTSDDVNKVTPVAQPESEVELAEPVDVGFVRNDPPVVQASEPVAAPTSRYQRRHRAPDSRDKQLLAQIIRSSDQASYGHTEPHQQTTDRGLDIE